MQVYRLARWMLLVAGSCASCCLYSQQQDCGQVVATVRMARSTSIKALWNERQNAGQNYRAHIVFAIRMFELNPQLQSADLLLDQLPADEEKRLVWMTLGDSLCNAESIADIKAMSKLGERSAHDLSRATLLRPARLSPYLSFVLWASQDPHSDAAIQAQKLCHADRYSFNRALDDLPPDKKRWFVEHVLRPESCHALSHPESD
jgi:hypothetical protein